MRRLLRLGLAALVAWWLLRRRRSEPAATVTVGYEDGSALRLAEGSPEPEGLLAIARELLAGR